MTCVLVSGDGIVKLPVSQTMVLDLQLSQEGIVDRLLTVLLDVERPDVDVRKKAIEADLIHHQHRLNELHVSVQWHFSLVPSIIVYLQLKLSVPNCYVYKLHKCVGICHSLVIISSILTNTSSMHIK